MRIDDLRTFVEVSKHSSMSKAAEVFNVGQSNVTMKMKRLEAYYQSNLFVRTPHGVRLTNEGKVLYERTVTMLHYWEQTNEMMSKKEVFKELFIGSMETTAAIRLPSLLAEVYRMYPNVMINLETGTTEQVLNKLMSYEIDAGFIAGPVKQSGVKGFPIFKEEMVLLTSKDLGERLDSTFIQLEGQNMLTFKTGCSYRRLLETFLYDHALTTTRKMEFGSIEAIIGCVKNGMGISILPYSVVENHNNVTLTALPSKYSMVETYFVYRENEWLSLYDVIENFGKNDKDG
ncbi:transcriptional regulator, LysR family [Bacillus sp. JCM 19047]|nr:transcriptional regulator, LysR family [Bacillus sp. JCM 19047]